MGEIIGYMCANLQSANKALDKIGKHVKAQVRFNRTCVLYAAAATACIVLANKRIEKQEEKIKQLDKKVNELLPKQEAKIVRGE